MTNSDGSDGGGLDVRRSGEGWAILTLDRPDRFNALSIDLRVALDRAVEELERDPLVRVLIVTGRGRTFTAGLDLDEWEASSEPAAAAFVHDAVRSLRRFTGPVIAAVQGAAITGGLEIALACDVIVASSDARFMDTHVRVGLLPGWGGSVRLVRRIGLHRAKELAFTARSLPAREALDWGLVNHVVEPERLLPFAEELARQMVEADPEHLAAYKRLLDEGAERPMGEALEHEARQAREFNARSSLAQIRELRSCPSGQVSGAARYRSRLSFIPCRARAVVSSSGSLIWARIWRLKS